MDFPLILIILTWCLAQNGQTSLPHQFSRKSAHILRLARTHSNNRKPSGSIEVATWCAIAKITRTKALPNALWSRKCAHKARLATAAARFSQCETLSSIASVCDQITIHVCDIIIASFQGTTFSERVFACLRLLLMFSVQTTKPLHVRCLDFFPVVARYADFYLSCAEVVLLPLAVFFRPLLLLLFCFSFDFIQFLVSFSFNFLSVH